jgi:hypothetical protein
MVVMPSSNHRLFFRSLLALLCLSALSCTTDYYEGPGGNIFLRDRRPPRYGHRGTESPEAGRSEETQPGMRRPRADAEADVGARTREGSEPPDDSQASSDTGERSRRGSDDSSPPADETPRTAESKPKATSDDSSLPFGVPVPGKEGVVYSPYTSEGYVDVRGMPPGSKAKCPYTKKIFRVP